MTTSARVWKGARLVSGALFVLAGAFKLTQRAAFAGALGHLGVPAPGAFALLVPGLEIVGGLALLSGRATRVAGALLALDMAAALLLVGVPGRLGRTLAVGTSSIGGEAWRLPLEIGLLIVAARTALVSEIDGRRSD